MDINLLLASFVLNNRSLRWFFDIFFILLNYTVAERFNLPAAVELSDDGGDGDDALGRTIHSTQFYILFHDSILNLLQFQSLHARFRAYAIPYEPRP